LDDKDLELALKEDEVEEEKKKPVEN